MAKVDHIQTSFAGGEFGASLFGRSDLNQYASACAVVENMLIRPFGTAISASGTEFIATCSISATAVRVIPFTFNRNDAYVLEMGVGYLRFLTEAGLVVSTGTTPFSVAHPFAETELKEIKFTQLNDIIWLFHRNHHPKRLVRYSATYWALEDIEFNCEPFMDDNTVDTTVLIISGTSGTINITSSTGTAVFTPSDGTTKGHWNTFWAIGGTTKTDSTTNLPYRGFVKITNVVSPTAVTATVIATLDCDFSAMTIGTNVWAEGAWSDLNGYPACGTFFESRLFTARTDEEPQKVWGSKPFIYNDFAVNSASDDDAINVQVASNESNEITWLVSGASLIAGTFGGEFIIGGGDAPVTPTNITVKKQTSWGSEAITPMRIGNYFYYVQRYGKKLRELFYFWDLDSYKSIDRTILSPHILGNGVVEMAYQQNPDTMVWCVLTDGTIAIMTREIDQEMTAWSRIKLGNSNDVVESICSIPSPTEPYDQVWVVVKRTITPTTGTPTVVRHIEMFKNIDIPRLDLCWYLHSSLRYSAYSDPAKSTGTISLSATTGTGVVVTTSVNYFVANDVNQRLRAIDADGVTIGEGRVVSYGSAKLVAIDIKKDFDALTYDSGRWGVSVTSVTGLSHLEGREVAVLADGGLDKPAKTVSKGAITLAYNYFTVLVGLKYIQKLKTLPVEAGSQRGTSQGKIQKVSQVAFRVNKSFKGFKTGGTEELAEKIQFRDPSTLLGTPEALYSGVIPNITFRDDYRYGSQIVVINEEPLPVELLNIIQTIDTNDK